MTDTAAISQTQSPTTQQRSSLPQARNEDSSTRPFGGILTGLIGLAELTRTLSGKEVQAPAAGVQKDPALNGLRTMAEVCLQGGQESELGQPLAAGPGQPDDALGDVASSKTALWPAPVSGTDPTTVSVTAAAQIATDHQKPAKKSPTTVDDTTPMDDPTQASTLISNAQGVAVQPSAPSASQPTDTEPTPTSESGTRGNTARCEQGTTASSKPGIRHTSLGAPQLGKNSEHDGPLRSESAPAVGSASAFLTSPPPGKLTDPSAQKKDSDASAGSSGDGGTDRMTIDGSLPPLATSHGEVRQSNADAEGLAMVSRSGTSGGGAYALEANNFTTLPLQSSPASAPKAPSGSSDRVPIHAPADQIIPVLIKTATAESPDRVTLHLSPPELGRLEIQIDRPSIGQAHVLLSVERPETLALLERDVSKLHEALDRAGLQADQRAVTFELSRPVIASAQSGEASQNAPDRQPHGQDASSDHAQPSVNDSAAGQSTGQQMSQRQSHEKWAGLQFGGNAETRKDAADPPAVGSTARQTSSTTIGINITA